MGLEVSTQGVFLPDRKVRIDSLPMGIDFDKFMHTSKLKKTQQISKKFKEAAHGQKIILSIDRLDYTKGIINRLQAFEQFLDTEPNWQQKVQMFLVVVPSRTSVERYQQMKQAIDEMVGHINGKFGTLDWSPIIYHYGSYEFEELVALYRASDVALVTPLRDGMNLVAKEYIASKTDKTGVLVLSELTGSAQELREAILVNPNHIQDITRGIKEALNMSKAQQIKMNTDLQQRLKAYTVLDWAEDFIEELAIAGKGTETAKTVYLNQEKQKILIKEFKEAHKPLLLLDYDGTLIGFAPTPQQAKPDPKLLSILKTLAKSAQVVLISGRDKNSLQNWFKDIPMDLVAEHGAYKYQTKTGWVPLLDQNEDWKPRVLPLLEIYSKRTPGSFIEYKDFSLVWHYRMANPELVAARTKELALDLEKIAKENNLQLMSGNKIIEIGRFQANKGETANQIIAKDNYDFVFAAGDDTTDENMFSSLDPSAYTVKIGATQTKARFRLNNPKELLDFLETLVK